MRDEFPEHFPLAEEEVTVLMARCWFVLDTNVLLNLYRYTPHTRDAYLLLIERLGDRLRIPHQVATEFFSARLKVIAEHNAMTQTLSKALTAAENEVRAKLEPLKRHSHINIVRLIERVESAFFDAQSEVRGLAQSRPKIDSTADPILDRLEKLLNDKIRPPLDEKAVVEVEKWAEMRYQQEVPPGFLDAKKSGNRKYGDAKIWWDVLDLGKSTGEATILVTDDVKDDWWLRPSGGKTIGPLPALRLEYRRISGNLFHMYQADRFLEVAGVYFKVGTDKESIDEATEVRDQQSQRERFSAYVSTLYGHQEKAALACQDQSATVQRLTASYAETGSERVAEALNAAKQRLASRTVTLHHVNELLAKAHDIGGRNLGVSPESSHGQDGTMPLLLYPCRVQEYYEVEDQHYQLDGPQTIGLTADELDTLNERGGVEWLSRLGSFYGLLEEPN